MSMAAIDKAIDFLRSYNKPNISEAARQFNVNRTTLSKQFSGNRGSRAKANELKQLLTKKQKLVLVRHISRLYK